MKIKDGVDLKGLNIVMRIVLISADLVWRKHGQELVVTSGLDGDHSAGSLHYFGYALDFRTRYFDNLSLISVRNDLQAELDKYDEGGYVVLLESDHIHVEFRRVLDIYITKKSK